MFRPQWKPVYSSQALGVLAVCAWVSLLALSSDDDWVRVLDDANLAFHEAGHLFYGVLGSTMGLYGGTLGQLTFPVVTAVAFLRQARAPSACLCVFWFFENFLNIARYMADARAQRLPLAGGGEHDWLHIFTRWGMLEHDTRLAALVGALGWLGMLASMAWLARRAWLDRGVGFWEPPGER